MRELNDLFEKQIHFISSLDPDMLNTKSVAFALSKRMVKWVKTQHRILELGRALAIEISWHDNTTLSILNIYALNSPKNNENFWKK